MAFALTPHCDELHDIDGHKTALDISTSNSVSELKAKIHKESQGLYELADLLRMESKFLAVYREHLDRSAPADEALYAALVATIVVLKEVHEAHGETCYYEPISKADYTAEDHGDHIDIRREAFAEGTIGGLLIAIFGGRQMSDEERQHRNHVRKMQRDN